MSEADTRVHFDFARQLERNSAICTAWDSLRRFRLLHITGLTK